MHADTIRTYKSVHVWVGIVTGLFLFVAFLAGALAVFKPHLSRWATPPALHGVTPLERADTLVARVLAEQPAANRQFTLHLGEAGQVPARLTWKDSPQDDIRHGAELAADGSLHTFLLDDSGLGQFVDDLHRTGGLPVEVELGAAFMGVVSGLYFLALVSGLVVLLPSLVKDLFALRLGKNVKRLWLDAHNLVGLVSLPFHLVIALTSVVFGLHDEIYAVLDDVVYRGQLRTVFQAENPFAAVPPDPRPATMLPPARLLEQVTAIAPDFAPVALEYRGFGTMGANVTVWGADPTRMVRGSGMAVLNAVSGQVVNSEYLPGRQGGYGTAISAFFALHFASFGGPVVKWGYLALGLGGAFLFYSGNLLWIESRRRRDKRGVAAGRQSPAARWMAALTVGIGLGTVAGLGLAVAGSKALHVVTDATAALRPWLFYAGLLTCLGWAAIGGAGRAAPRLLWVAAATTALVPSVSVAAILFPGLGLWAWPDSLAVDLTAAALAVALALLAVPSARRAKLGPADSVWSATAVSDSPAASS